LRKLTVLLLTFAFVLAFQAGSAAAQTKLEQAFDGLIGVRYQYGGTTPSGFDCSGFTSYVFKKLGIDLPRTSKDQFAIGQKVDQADLIAGDLVFFNTSGHGVSHVGIYIGDGKFVHASSSKGVTITALTDKYYVKRYLGARRIMDNDTYLAVATEPKAEAAVSAVSAQVAAEPAEEVQVIGSAEQS